LVATSAWIGTSIPDPAEPADTAGHWGAFGHGGLRGMLSYTVDDAITDPLTCSVEVTIDFGDRKRWLFFVTPPLLASVGDWVPGMRVRLHLGERHMVVVSELSAAVIEAVLRQLHADGELESRTLPLRQRRHDEPDAAADSTS
jgi:hypothetical protein